MWITGSLAYTNLHSLTYKISHKYIIYDDYYYHFIYMFNDLQVLPLPPLPINLWHLISPNRMSSKNKVRPKILPHHSYPVTCSSLDQLISLASIFIYLCYDVCPFVIVAGTSANIMSMRDVYDTYYFWRRHCEKYLFFHSKRYKLNWICHLLFARNDIDRIHFNIGSTFTRTKCSLKF